MPDLQLTVAKQTADEMFSVTINDWGRQLQTKSPSWLYPSGRLTCVHTELRKSAYVLTHSWTVLPDARMKPGLQAHVKPGAEFVHTEYGPHGSINVAHSSTSKKRNQQRETKLCRAAHELLDDLLYRSGQGNFSQHFRHVTITLARVNCCHIHLGWIDLL